MEATSVESAADFAPLAAALAATLAQVSERLDGATAELSAARRVIVNQAETIGRQGAELEAERERGKSFHVELEQARSAQAAAELSRRRDTRRLSLALAVAGMLAVASTLAPGWVR